MHKNINGPKIMLHVFMDVIHRVELFILIKMYIHKRNSIFQAYSICTLALAG